MILEETLLKAKDLYDRYIVDDQTRSIAIVELTKLIMNEDRNRK